jgi:hypothetical protein
MYVYHADLSNHMFWGRENRPLKEGNDIPKQENRVMFFLNVKYTANYDSHTHAYAADAITQTTVLD